MINGKKVLAIIPARGGSKGLPGKNIIPLLGKPLIGWSIEQAKASQYIDEIFISTDSREIANVCERFGMEVASLRPAQLATDTAKSIDFILYTIEKLESEGKTFDYIILLEPTSPLRDTEDIDKSLEDLNNNPDAESIVGICKTEGIHPAFLTRLNNRFLIPYQDNNDARRQDVEDLYFFEGSIYASTVSGIKNYKKFYHEKCLGYIVPKWKSYEIDDFIDLSVCETIMQLKMEKKIK